MFNSSIDTSQFPSNWKVARVTPIFKEGDKTEKSNYRPISVLSVISRVFEKLIANKLSQYFGDNDPFHPGQSRFRKLHSTLACLIKNTDDWYSELDAGKLVGLECIDLKRHLTLLTMAFYVENWNIMESKTVNWLGSNHIR